MNKDQKTNETDNPQKGTEYLDILKTKWDKKSNLGEEIQKKLLKKNRFKRKLTLSKVAETN